MKKIAILVGLCGCLVQCTPSGRPIDPKAKAIVEQCIEAHGGANYQRLDVSFDFRKFRVRIQQTDTSYVYERSTRDSLGNEIKDRLSNRGFERTLNGQLQALSAKDTDKYREGINSVAYFVLLPYKLQDPAVNLAYLGETTLNGQTYDKIKVWFEAEGGGKDHEDVFCYWINRQSHTLDYLAYANGGPRFRKATKREKVAGVVFQDYENYEIQDTTIATTDYDRAFVAGKAKLLSKIEQSNYQEPSAQ